MKTRREKKRAGRKNIKKRIKEVIRQTKSAQRAEYEEDRPMGAFEKGAVPL